MSEPIVRSIRWQWSLAFFAAGLAALAVVVPAQAKPLSEADRDFVDATIEAAMQEDGQPGVSITISGPKWDYTRAYGVGNRETGAPLSLDDHFRIASITKTFTATAILRQVDKGRLRLTDTLDKWIEGFPYGERITVRDMLAMRSGIYDYTQDPEFLLRFR